jgi:hypothetical protein
MKIKQTSIVLLLAITVATKVSADTAINIDFSTYAPSTSISSLQGVSFAVLGGPGAPGTPATSNSSWPDSGLSNSTTGNEPTGTILDINFGNATASNVTIGFDNFGLASDASRGTTTFAEYAINGSILATGSITSASLYTLSLPTAGVHDIQFNNGTSGESSWLFDVKTLSATVSSVPETDEWAMMLLGFPLVGWVIRRK